MTDKNGKQAERDIEREQFVQKLVDTGMLYMPAGAIVHDLGMAGWLKTSSQAIRRQMFCRTDGDSVYSRRVCSRDLTTVEQVHKWIEDGATAHTPNEKLSRRKEAKSCRKRRNSDG